MIDWLINIYDKSPDWLKRAIKTFIQAFLGVMVPETVVLLNGSLPRGIDTFSAAITPVVCSALAAGISAGWNIYVEYIKKNDTFDEVE